MVVVVAVVVVVVVEVVVVVVVADNETFRFLGGLTWTNVFRSPVRYGCV